MTFVQIEWQSPWYHQEIDLRDRLLRQPLGLKFSEEDLAAEIDQMHFGLIEDKRVVACCLVKPLTDKMVKLRQMAVDTDNQGKGLGRMLVAAVEQKMQDEGYCEIELHAREVVKGFYEAIGFVAEGDRFHEVGIPHFKMRKQLK